MTYTRIRDWNMIYNTDRVECLNRITWTCPFCKESLSTLDENQTDQCKCGRTKVNGFVISMSSETPNK